VRQIKPKGFWTLVQQRLFWMELERKLNIQKPEDWYTVTVEKAVRMGANFITRQYNGSMIRGTSCRD
jgi:hypothetical protein